MPKQKTVLLMLKRDIHQLEYDPETQYRFHFWATWFWLLNMPLILILLICFPKFWLLIALVYITEISLWALVATYLGAMSAALAAKQQTANDGEKTPNQNVIDAIHQETIAEREPASFDL